MTPKQHFYVKEKKKKKNETLKNNSFKELNVKTHEEVGQERGIDICWKLEWNGQHRGQGRRQV